MITDEYPHTVIFQKSTKVSDGGGGGTRQWTDYLTTEAFVDPIHGTELYQAMQLTNPVNIRVYFPFSEEGLSIDGSMVVKWVDRNQTLKVQSRPIDQGGMGEILLVECLLDGTS